MESRDGRPLIYGRETEPSGDAETASGKTRRKKTSGSRAAPTGSDTAASAAQVDPGSKKSLRSPTGRTKDSAEARLELVEARVEELRCALQASDLNGPGIAGQGPGLSLDLRAYIDSRIDEKLAAASVLPLASPASALAESDRLAVKVEPTPSKIFEGVASFPRTSRQSRRAMLAGPSLLDRGDACSMDASVWDMCAFVGHPCLGWKVSVMAFIPYFINMGLQSLFCLIVKMALVNQSVVNGTLEGLFHFRLGVAHNVQYADSVTYQSLASQICHEDFKLQYAGSQLGLNADVLAFQKAYGAMYLGHWLAVMAQFLWVSTALSEIFKTIEKTRVLLGLPKTAVTRICAEVRGDIQGGNEAFTEEDDVVVKIESISRGRCMWVLAGIALPRLIIASFVCLIGILYLGETFRIGDLILNAIALAFILDCDELLFEMFAPYRIASLQRHLEPIPVKPAPWKYWPWAETFLKGLLISGIMFLIYGYVLAPFHWRLQQAHYIMCSGDTDFVYAVNSASGMVHVAKSKAYEAGNWTYVEKVVLQAAQSASPLEVSSDHGWTLPSELQAIFGSTDEEANIESGEYQVSTLSNATFHTGDFDRVSDMQTWTTDVSAQFLPCSDLGAGIKDAVLNKLRLVVDDPTILSCQDVDWRLCSQQDMSELRALCPVMCNCNLPSDRGAITGFFGHPKFGCPVQCASQVAANSERYYLEHLGDDYDLKCADLESDDLIYTGGECVDSDWNSDGDKFGETCWADKYWEGNHANPSHPCKGSHDDSDFTAGTMCCDCGGGITTNSSLSSYSCSQDLGDDCFWIGSVARFWMLYVNGLFEYLTSQKGFEDMIMDSLEDDILPIQAQHYDMLVDYIVTGRMKQSLLEHDWKFAPQLDHPRNLVGCEYLTSWEFKLLLNVDLCSPQSFASIQRLCPKSCGCGSGSSMRECPMQCVAATNSSTV